MLQFKRDGKKVVAVVDTGTGINGVDLPWWNFYFNVDHEASAQVMADHLQAKMDGELERIRTKAYEQGWKDAKAKHRKQTWQYVSWND